jgi:hypothetical protein
MKLKKEHKIEMMPVVHFKRLILTCSDCGREFVYTWKKGTTRQRYCTVCKAVRRRNSKEKYREEMNVL